MKQSLKLLSPLFWAAIFLFGGRLLGQTCTGNLLQNASFENGGTAWEGSAATVAGGANGSANALRICASGTTARQTLAAQAGKMYSLNGFLKKDATANVFVFMKFLSATWQPLEAPYANWPQQGTTFSAFESLTRTAPAGTAWLEISVLHNGGTGCVWADELCLTESGGGSGQPDLLYGSVNFPQSLPASGAAVATVVVTNGGAANSTANFVVRAVLSPTAVPTQPFNVIGTINFQGIAAGAAATSTGTVTVPAGTASGSYFIVFIIDAAGQIAESNEANNNLPVPISVTGGGGGQPDLTITNLNLNAQTVEAGKVISYRFDLTNASTTAISGNFNVKSYFSTDDILSSNDVQDGIVPTGNFPAGFSATQVLGASTAPASLAPGLYFLILKADADNQVSESDEANNVIVAQTVINVTAPTTATASPCSKFVGNGLLLCAEAVPNSPNFRTVIDAAGMRTRTTFSPNGTVVSSENLGAVPPLFFQSLNIAGGTVLEKKNPDGSVVFSKPLPAATIAAAFTLFSPVEVGTGFAMLGWKSNNPAQPYFMDSLFAFKTDANGVILLKKFVLQGTGYPGGNSASLTVLDATRFVLSTNSSLFSTNWTGVLRVLDQNFVEKSARTIYSNIWSAGFGVAKNVCRGWTVTDQQGLGYCKSGGCYAQNLVEYDLVGDQFVPYSFFKFYHQTTVGVGTENYDWETPATDGGKIQAFRYLSGQISGNTNDSITVKKINATGATVWTKKVRVPQASNVKKIAESGGQIYFLSLAQNGDWSFQTLECLENAPPPTGPDLILGAFITPPSAAQGGSGTAQIFYQNAGTAAVGAHKYGLYLSNGNAAVDVFDLLLGSFTVNSLAVGATGSNSISFTIPAQQQAGTNYFLVAKADSDNQIAEAVESNNEKGNAFSITTNPPPPTGCTNNLLTGAGFEPGGPLGWEADQPAVFTIILGGANGSSSAIRTCENGKRIYQTKAATAGTAFTARVFAKNDGTGIPQGVIAIKFLSATWQPLASHFDPITATSTSFVESVSTKTAPANTAWVELSFFKTSGTGCLILDDACLTTSTASGCSPDVTPPNFTVLPADATTTITSGTGTPYIWGNTMASDNCAGPVTITSSIPNGSFFPIGTTTVTFTARDAANNSTTATLNITVILAGVGCSPDVTPPVLSACPANQNLTTSGTTQTATWTPPTATDNCPGNPAVLTSHFPGSTFGIGTTTVTYTAVDNASNTATCSFTITVTGGQPPTGCAGNLLTNPSFELAGLNNWSGSGATAIAGGANGTSQAANLATNGIRIYQTKAATAGKTYVFKAFAKNAGGAANGTLAIKFMNASFSPLVSEFKIINSTNTFSEFSVQKLAPTGTVWVEVSIIKETGAGSLVVDETCLTDGAVAPTCVFTAAASNVACQNNGTASDPSDDTFTFSLLATQTGGNCGTGWTANGQSGSYGVSKNFGPFPISGGPINLVINDNQGLYGLNLAPVNPPLTCSGAVSSCDKIYSTVGVSDFQTCGEKTASGFTVTSLNATQKVVSTFDASRNLVNSTASTRPDEVSYVISNGSINKILNGNQVSSTPIPASITNTYTAVGGAFERTGGAGWWLFLRRNDGASSALLRTSAAFSIQQTLVVPSVSTANAVQPSAIRPLADGSVVLSTWPSAPFADGKLMRTNAAATAIAYEITAPGRTTDIQVSLCGGADRFFVKGFTGQSGGSGGSTNIDYYSEAALGASNGALVSTYSNRSSFQQPNVQTSEHINRAFLAGGQSLVTNWQSNLVPPSSGTVTASVSKLNAAGTAIWTQNLPTNAPTNGFLSVFEDGATAQSVTVFGKSTGGSTLFSTVLPCATQPPSGGADLKITVTADKTTVPQWGNVTFTVTAKNEGTAPISNATIVAAVCGPNGVAQSFDQASKLVYAGSPPPPTVGQFNFLNLEWKIANLAAGAQGVLTLPLFTTSASEKKVAAWVTAQSPTDPDSQPSTSVFSNCVPLEDDESVFTINLGNPLLAGEDRAEKGSSIALEGRDFSIQPNPTTGQTRLFLPLFLGEKMDVEVVDLAGRRVFFQAIEKLETSFFDLDLEAENAGLFFVRVRPENARPVVKRLIINKL